MIGGNEAHARVLINAQIKDQSWDVQDPNSVRYEVPLKDGTFADYVLCDRHGRSLAVIEAKRSATNPTEAEDQAKNYAQQLGIPFIFLSNGAEIRFWDWQREVFPRPVKTFFGQDDLIRRGRGGYVGKLLPDKAIVHAALYTRRTRSARARSSSPATRRASTLQRQGRGLPMIPRAAARLINSLREAQADSGEQKMPP